MLTISNEKCLSSDLIKVYLLFTLKLKSTCFQLAFYFETTITIYLFSALIFKNENFPTNEDKKLYFDSKIQAFSTDKLEEALEVCLLTFRLNLTFTFTFSFTFT